MPEKLPDYIARCNSVPPRCPAQHKGKRCAFYAVVSHGPASVQPFLKVTVRGSKHHGWRCVWPLPGGRRDLWRGNAPILLGLSVWRHKRY